jgi:hypothetical protein
MTDDELFSAWHSFLVILNSPLITDRKILFDKYMQKLTDYYLRKGKLIKFSDFVTNIDKLLSIDFPIPREQSLVPHVKKSIELMEAV